MNNQEIIATLKRLGYLASFLLSAILVISAVEQKQESSASKLTIAIDPLANGRFLIDSSDVYKTIERSFGFDLVGQQIGNLNVERLERVLEADPFVLNADVYINAENQIDIEIQQREPVLRVIDENGLNYYLDKEGNKLPLSPHFTARVLVATGSLPPHVPDFRERDDYLLNEAFQLAQFIRSDPFWNALVEQIHTRNGEFILIPKVGRQEIVFGPYEEVENKFWRLKKFYEEALPYQGWQAYKRINVSFDGQVVCEKR